MRCSEQGNHDLAAHVVHWGKSLRLSHYHQHFVPSPKTAHIADRLLRETATAEESRSSENG